MLGDDGMGIVVIAVAVWSRIGDGSVIVTGEWVGEDCEGKEWVDC